MQCCFQDLFSMTHSILVQFPSSFFFIHLVIIHIVELMQLLLGRNYIFSGRSVFHMINNLSITLHAFARHILMSFSVVETLLPILIFHFKYEIKKGKNLTTKIFTLSILKWARIYLILWDSTGQICTLFESHDFMWLI